MSDNSLEIKKGRISVITSAYNNPDKLDMMLASIDRDQPPTGGLEVLVVDDGSSRDLGSVVGKHNVANYIRLESNSGPSRGRNVGARHATGEYLVFFDSDVVLKSGTLRKFEERFKEGADAVVGEYDSEPIGKSFFAHFKALITESWTPKSEHVSVFALRAAGVKRSLFDKVGGFDENITTASVEDYDFADRLAKAGVKITYDPDILVQHHHPGYIKQIRLFYLRARDWAELFVKRGFKFDNWCASPTEGAASVAGTIFVLSALIAYAFRDAPAFVIMPAVSGMIYIVTNSAFIKTAVKRRGILFVPVGLLVKLPLSIAITAGFCVGIVKLFIKRTSKGRA